jgi:hypothetical protein
MWNPLARRPANNFSQRTLFHGVNSIFSPGFIWKNEKKIPIHSTKPSPSWESASRSATQEFHKILRNPKVHYRVHNSLLLSISYEAGWASVSVLNTAEKNISCACQVWNPYSSVTQPVACQYAYGLTCSDSSWEWFGFQIISFFIVIIYL